MDETSIIAMITNTAAGPTMLVTAIGVLSAVAFAAAGQDGKLHGGRATGSGSRFR